MKAQATIGSGPYYPFKGAGGSEVLSAHLDKARYGVWRVSYPDGRNASEAIRGWVRESMTPRKQGADREPVSGDQGPGAGGGASAPGWPEGSGTGRCPRWRSPRSWRSPGPASIGTCPKQRATSPDTGAICGSRHVSAAGPGAATVTAQSQVPSPPPFPPPPPSGTRRWARRRCTWDRPGRRPACAAAS